MGDQFRVTGEFCIAGNPTKAWHGSTGEDDTVHVPDDVWQEQVHPFAGDLDAAKAFVLGLDLQMTTHVCIEHSADDGVTWECIVAQDSDADHIVGAAPGVVPPSQVDSLLPGEHRVEESLTPYPAQEGGK